MKKKFTLFFIFLMATCHFVNAQYFYDDFDNYKPGKYLGLQSSKWTTWSHNPGGSDDVLVDSMKSLSGKNSLYFKSNNITPNDVVLPFGNKIHNSGKFRFSSNFYIPKGKAAYFNIQADTTVGVSWAIEFTFNSAGNYVISNTTNGSLLSASSFPMDQWFELALEINLDSGIWELLYNNSSQGTFKNSLPVSQLDIFCSDTAKSEFWMDNVSYCVGNSCNPEIEMQSVSVYPNPVCSFDSAQVTIKLKNNSKFNARNMILGVEVGNETVTKTIGLNYLASGKDTTISVAKMFYAKTAGKNIEVKAINKSGDINSKNDTAKGKVDINASPSNIVLGNDTVVCAYSNITLSVATGLSKYEWSTGGTSQTEKIDTSLKNMTSGKNKVWLKVTDKQNCSFTDTIVIDFLNSPAINLGADKELCEGQSYGLKGAQAFYYHEWTKFPSTNILSTNSYLNVDSSGIYIAKITTIEGCVNYDTVEMIFHPNPMKPSITTSANPIICKDDTLKLNAPVGYSKYVWSNGENKAEILINSTQKITLKVTDSNGCESPISDIIDVIVNPLPAKPQIKLNGKTFICSGDSVELEAPANYSIYIWSNGNKSQFNQIMKDESVTVQVIDSIGCKSPISNPVKVIVYPLLSSPIIQLTGDTAFCPGGSATLTATSGKQYVWNDGQTVNQRVITQSGSFYVMQRDVNNCKSLPSNIVNITVYNKPLKPVISPNDEIFLCEGDKINLSVPTGSQKYFWSDSSHQNSINVDKEGSYWVRIQNAEGCLSDISVAVNIKINPLPNKPTIKSIGTTKLQCAENGQRYRWYKEGNLISDTFKTINVTAQGFYQVQIAEKGCWSKISDSFNYDFSSVKSIQNYGLNIYPNPTKSFVNIQLDNLLINEDILIQIMDLQGKLILETSIILEENKNGKMIDLEKLNPGVYFIKISNSEMLISRKIEKL